MLFNHTNLVLVLIAETPLHGDQTYVVREESKVLSCMSLYDLHLGRAG